MTSAVLRQVLQALPPLSDQRLHCPDRRLVSAVRDQRGEIDLEATLKKIDLLREKIEQFGVVLNGTQLDPFETVDQAIELRTELYQVIGRTGNLISQVEEDLFALEGAKESLDIFMRSVLGFTGKLAAMVPEVRTLIERNKQDAIVLGLDLPLTRERRK